MYDDLVNLGISLGKPGDSDRELVVGAAYDLVCLANVGHMLPLATQQVTPIETAIKRWRNRTDTDQPFLGLATTRELMLELQARSEVHSDDGTVEADIKSDMSIYLDRCAEDFLNYRTVGS